jgi:heme O synthase-like polyprenyltransferase
VASEPILSAFDLPVAKRSRVRDSKIWFDYFALTKPEVNFLILVTTFTGFYLGCASAWHDFPFLRSINAVLGTLLVASGTGALNQYIERHFDAQMRRGQPGDRWRPAGSIHQRFCGLVSRYRFSELCILPLQ